jgi:hypothetical protein
MSVCKIITIIQVIMRKQLEIDQERMDTHRNVYPLGYGLWVMGYGLWVMGYGLWVMGYGSMGHF